MQSHGRLWRLVAGLGLLLVSLLALAACGSDGSTSSSASPSSDPQSPAAEGITITSVTSPIGLGGMATLTAQTSGGAACSIVYKHPSGKVSTAPELTPKTAGSDGTVTWTWTISTGTRPKGTGSITVTCNGASAQSPIVIQ